MNILKIKNKIALGLGVLILGLAFLGLGSPAHAVVTPANAVMNPVTETLYVPDNDATRGVRIYQTVIPTSWEEELNARIDLTGKCMGLAVWHSGNEGRLLVSENNGTSSTLKYYRLGQTGLPAGNPQEINITALGSSPMGVAILSTGNVAYLADAGSGRIYILDYNAGQDEWALRGQYGYIWTDFNVFDIAVSPDQSGSHTVYVSTKVASGKIIAYNSSDLTGDDRNATPASQVTNLTHPTYLKLNADGSRLYAAVNGATGGDIKVFDTSDLINNVITVSSITGAYGWTGFEVAADESYLYFSQVQNASENETKVYNVPLPLSGDLAVTDQDNLTGALYKNIDGVIANLTHSKLAASYSGDGSISVLDSVPNAQPHLDVNSMGQFKLNETTPIPKGGETNENQIFVRFNVSDGDGQDLTVRVFTQDPSQPATWQEVGFTVVAGDPANPIPVAMTIPQNGTFNNGEYEWRVSVTDGLSTEEQDFNNDAGSADFIVNAIEVDITPPADITDLIAVPGTNPGEVDLTWTAPGDDGWIGTVAGYRVRYIASATALTDAFAGGFEDARAVEYDTTAWAGLSAGGNVESRTLTGLPFDVGSPTYIYITIISSDEVPNWSGISNIASTFVRDHIPPPVVTLVYPNQAPNSGDTNIVIEGENFVSPADVQLKANPSTALTNVVVENLNRITATVPSGVTPGTYHITVTTSGGESPETPADEFTVMAGPEQPPDPSQVIDFRVVSGNGQCTLLWTNPNDMDMAEITVRRAITDYPQDPTAGYEVYGGGVIPTPGQAMNIVDPGLTNGQIYYYVVYIRDTSNNWSVLDYDSTDGEQNAATGEPSTSVNPVINLPFDPARGNIFWVSIPYDNPYTTAADVLADINQQNGLPADSANLISSIGRWSGLENPQIYYDYSYLGQIIGWSGDFNLVTGEAIYLNIVANTTFTLQGSHDPSFVFDFLQHDGSRGNIFWISLPNNGDYTDAVGIIADINSSANPPLPADSGDLVSQAGRFTVTQQYEDYSYLGMLGWQGINYTFQPGEGYYINLEADVTNWSPATQ
jgi:hypothetical protein